MRALQRTPAPSVGEFLTSWYGPPDRAVTDIHDANAPRPLIAWFTTTSAWSRPVTVQNDMVHPSDVTIEDGKALFYVENQAVWAWAYDPDDPDPDPAVYDRENEENGPWTPSGLSLSTFLLQATVLEAVMGAPYSASAAWVDDVQLAAILAPLRPLPGPAWNWPPPGGHRLYAGDDLLAFAGPTDIDREPTPAPRRCEVFVAAREPGRLAYLSGVPEVTWSQPPGVVNGR